MNTTPATDAQVIDAVAATTLFLAVVSRPGREAFEMQVSAENIAEAREELEAQLPDDTTIRLFPMI